MKITTVGRSIYSVKSKAYTMGHRCIKAVGYIIGTTVILLQYSGDIP
jgi:hypothetical protein